MSFPKRVVAVLVAAVCVVVALWLLAPRGMFSPVDASRNAPAESDTSTTVISRVATAPVAPASVKISPEPAIAEATTAPSFEREPTSVSTVLKPASTLPPVSPAAALPPDTPEAIAALPPSTVNGLLIPVVGIKPSQLVDTFTQARGQRRVHDAIDILAPRGTPVVAAHDGHVVKLFTSKRGGLTVYQFDPEDRVIYYYAHLNAYAPGLAEGQILQRGDPIGFVGSTGNASANAPHLHFEIEMLGPKKQWWHGTSINPYGHFAGQR